MTADNKKPVEPTAGKRPPWTPMSITHLGDIGQLVQTGSGKLSVAGGDPGESRKQMGGTD